MELLETPYSPPDSRILKRRGSPSQNHVRATEPPVFRRQSLILFVPFVRGYGCFLDFLARLIEQFLGFGGMSFHVPLIRLLPG
jgi:hypothetical protein